MQDILKIDLSLVVIFALVGILFLVLNKLYYKPISQVIDARETKIKKENEQIESLSHDINERTQYIETVLKEAQKEARKAKEELIKTGEDVRGKIVGVARENARERFEKQMQLLDQQISTAEQQLEQEISVFSEKMQTIFS